MAAANSLTLIERSVEHRFARNGDTRIHVATAGDGRLVLFLHGFPDHWLTWHAVMAPLLKTHRVAAMDLKDSTCPISHWKPATMTCRFWWMT